MPFVSQAELNALHQHNERLATELARFESLRPSLALAGEIQAEIETVLENNLDLPASEIGDIAYDNVLNREHDKATGELAAEYEQAHRRVLYARVLDNVRDAEGDDINAEVQRKLDTDPDLAVELRNSARRELGARAMDKVNVQMSQVEEEAVDAEADRQLALDRFDVELAVNGKLNLNRDTIRELLQPGDKIDLFFKTAAGYKEKIVLKWTIDVRDKCGWVIDHVPEKLCDSSGMGLDVSVNRFIKVGSMQPDLSTGKQEFVPHILVTGQPVGFCQPNKRGSRDDVYEPYTTTGHVDRFSQNAVIEPVILEGCDLQTKHLKFFTNGRES